MSDFDAVRAERDPLRQAVRAGELITVYQQRAVELARLRKQAINQLLADGGMSSAEVARKLGLSKGRVTQIRQTAPPAERSFFGVGPITLAVPLREVPGRALPVIASEDAQARDALRDFLEKRLAFAVEPFGIPTSGQWQPAGDVVAICGPKSSPVTSRAIASDPVLDFSRDDDGRWTIKERESGRQFGSPMDADKPEWSDIAYVGRLHVDEQPITIIAGIHALGSVGAVDYLIRNLPRVAAAVGDSDFSMIVESAHRDGEVLTAEALAGPWRHQ
ncbi:winged helix-turn-helix domain-containing protein [Actinoplanes sp. NPDC004185]